MASSSNSLPDNSITLDTVSKHIQEEKKRYDRLNSLIKSFQAADKEKSQLIHALQQKSHLSSFEQEYLDLLRSQCMKDWQNTSACSELFSSVGHQTEEKQHFLEIKYKENEEQAVNMETDEPPIVFAESAEDFFFRGDGGKTDDDQYCTITFLDHYFVCSRKFWGVLLGYTPNNRLLAGHIDAWIRESLLVHRHLIQQERREGGPRRLARYAVMPLSFNDQFVMDPCSQTTLDFANGTERIYLPWRSVNSVLIPISSLGNHWFLVEYKILENELIIYNHGEASQKSRAYMNNIMRCYKQDILLTYLTVTNTGRTPVPDKINEDAQPRIYTKNLTQYTDSRNQSALFVCMFIHNLVRGENSECVTADISDEQATAFRKMMANALYAKRTE